MNNKNFTNKTLDNNYFSNPRRIILVGFGILVIALLTVNTLQNQENKSIAEIKKQNLLKTTALEDKVFPKNGVSLPIVWGDLGAQMIEVGVIDATLFENIYSQRGGLDKISKDLLYSKNNKQIVINQENAGLLLNMFWAFGLSNRNVILEEGPMMDMKYGGNAGSFASTGGWSLAVGDPMNHYSKHSFISLTNDQQEKIENVAKNIYRPCCGNSTYFPDCNHGMAMLGLLELLASNGATEEEMYQMALVVNSYWFPDTYLTLATYFEQQGIDWGSVNPQLVLGVDYSSGSGYQRVLKELDPIKIQSGGGCSI